MNTQHQEHENGCRGGSCCSRRTFLTSMSVAAGALAFAPMVSAVGGEMGASRPKEGALVRAVFIYPPSSAFASKPDAWWSWPGNEFDAEGRQAQYVEALRASEAKFGMRVQVDEEPVGSIEAANRVAEEIRANPPDGLLIVMFFNANLAQPDALLKAAEDAGIPAIFYIGLGVRHGSIRQYRRPGVYFIQSLDNLDAIEYGLRMINTKKRIGQCRLLSITEAEEPREGVEPFLGARVRVIPFLHYAEAFDKVKIDAEARAFIAAISDGAREIRGVTQEAFENAARAHFALKRLLDEEGAVGVTMNCLRRGMLKPCVSFATLNSEGVPAACENDLPALYTQLLGQYLTGRPGFQHNPCFETEHNHYYGSHCTCPSKVYGPDGPDLPYLLRRFAHTNEGSCAIQVFWNPGDEVTMMRYYPGESPGLDVYAGKVVVSHPMPPAGGCTTNVAIEITDRRDACMVQGHHNLIFCGDFARQFRLFAQLYKMRLVDSGFEGAWPV